MVVLQNGDKCIKCNEKIIIIGDPNNFRKVVDNYRKQKLIQQLVLKSAKALKTYRLSAIQRRIDARQILTLSFLSNMHESYLSLCKKDKWFLNDFQKSRFLEPANVMFLFCVNRTKTYVWLRRFVPQHENAYSTKGILPAS